MLGRALVLLFEIITFIAAGSFALIWLALAFLIVASIVRLARSAESLDPFEWLAYMKSPKAAELAESLQFSRRLVQYGFVCVLVAAVAGVAAGICAGVFHIR